MREEVRESVPNEAEKGVKEEKVRRKEGEREEISPETQFELNH